MMRLIAPFLPYLMTALVTAVIGVAAWNMTLTHENRALRAELRLVKGQKASCDARVLDILEDKQSDATVTDPGTFPAPDGWFLPQPHTLGTP